MTTDAPGPPTSLTRAQRRARGKTLREVVPRSAHAEWKPPEARGDIVALLEESSQGRLPDLIPLRYGRMLRSPLACLRGSAVVMADDLSHLPTTNIRLQSCGDCHLQNFGWFASPERNLIFDINDFDETRTAPWEWDVKRLVASVVLAARGLGASKARQLVLGQAVVKEYRERLAGYESLSPLEMWYVRLDAAALLDHAPEIAARGRSQEILASARQRTMDHMFPKMTQRVDGKLRFQDRPPLIFHPPKFDEYLHEIHGLMQQYRGTLSDERLLMLDPDDCPLVLQLKEARASVLEKYVGRSERTHHGHRIVHGQRVMQAASDLFLGWASDSEGRDFYVRQLRDMKLSLDIERMALSELEEYARLCGWGLARAHAKAGDASSITGYLGTGSQFDEALARFAFAYATQAEEDFATLKQAAASGRIAAAKIP
jgi:uncharacterized protein (DUF2252 family)